MLLEPNTIVLHVNDLTLTSPFYQDLLGITPEEASPTFHAFKLSNGMSLALKAQHSVEPPAEGKNGNCELAFTLDDNQKVDDLFAAWQAKEINIIMPPNIVPYGYTFVAADPDGNRLRIVSLGKSD